MKRLLAVLALAIYLPMSAAAYANDDTGPNAAHQGDHHGMFEKLPQADAQLIHDTMKKAHEDSKPLMAQEKKLHQDLHAILTADQFDDKAFISKQAKLQAVHDKIKAHMIAAFASALAQLSPEDRETIADSMAEHHHWHNKASWHGRAAGDTGHTTEQEQ